MVKSRKPFSKTIKRYGNRAIIAKQTHQRRRDIRDVMEQLLHKVCQINYSPSSHDTNLPSVNQVPTQIDEQILHTVNSDEYEK